jgi:hypothetical protein
MGQKPQISFRLGQIVATPGALEALNRSGQTPDEFLTRHQRGDWGQLCAADAKLNDEAVAHEADADHRTRVLSAYRTTLNERIWVITEADRSTSTILMPEEY